MQNPNQLPHLRHVQPDRRFVEHAARAWGLLLEKLMPASKSNAVKRTLDLKNSPPLTDAQKARLTTVAVMPNEQIDYTDAPHLPDAVWAEAGDLPSARPP